MNFLDILLKTFDRAGYFLLLSLHVFDKLDLHALEGDLLSVLQARYDVFQLYKHVIDYLLLHALLELLLTCGLLCSQLFRRLLFHSFASGCLGLDFDSQRFGQVRISSHQVLV